MQNDFQEYCRRLIHSLLIGRSWELVQDEVSFVKEVLAELEGRPAATPAHPLETAIEQAALKCYSRIWYAACRADGTARQQRAFEELHRFLYRVAFNRVDHDEYRAQECAQQAIVKVWQKLDQVVDPGCFMWWALRVVNNVVNRQFTSGKRKVIDPESGEISWVQVEVTATDLPSDHQSTAPEDGLDEASALARADGLSVNQEPTMTDEIRVKLAAAISDCLDNERHQAVIIKTFLDAKSRQEVAAELGITAEVVSVFKQRAVKYLRECEGFMAVLEELL